MGVAPFIVSPGRVYTSTFDGAVAGSSSGPYYGFPGVTKTGTTLVAIARKGTDHLVGGDLVKFTSTDDGSTWSAETVIRNNAKDIRDVEVTTLANGDLLCSFTERTEGGSDYIPYVMRSTDGGATWGTAVAITHGFSSWGFISAKIVQLANGDLLAPLYGSDGGADYCRMSRSTDGGATWANLSTIASGGGRVWDEPNAALDGADIVCLIRSDTGTAGIYLVRSTDSGATWSAPTRLFDGSGRPSLHIAANGDYLCAYRHTDPSTGRSAVRWSLDDGATWEGPQLLNSTGVYMYGSFVALTSSIGLFWCTEATSTRSDAVFDRLVGG